MSIDNKNNIDQINNLRAELWIGIQEPSFIFSIFDSIEDLKIFIDQMIINPNVFQKVFAIDESTKNKIFNYKINQFNKLFKKITS